MLRHLVLAALILAVTVWLANALVTRDHVGGGEYIVGAALLGALVLSLFRVTRRAIRRA